MKLLFCILFFCVSSCYATMSITCTYSNSPLQFSTSQITVQRDHPMDTAIGPEITVDESMINCNSSATVSMEMTMSVTVIATQVDSGKKINSRSIFLTNLPGVGYAIGINNWAWNNRLHWVGDGYDYSTVSTHSSGNFYGPSMGFPIATGSTIHLQLYKIDNLNSGIVSSGAGTLSGSILTGDEDLATTAVLASTSVPVNISSVPVNVVKCELNAGKMLIPVGDVPVEQFTGAGSTSQQTSTANLGLNCDPDANITITLTGTPNPDIPTNKTVLGLSDQGVSGVAVGIGVQLMYDNAPIELNKMLNLKRSAGGQESFPLTARYYQTRDTVKAGSANATAVLNLTYQ